MIATNTLYNRIQNLTIKEQAGYSSSLQATSDFQEANKILFNYYYDVLTNPEKFEETNKSLDALLPFIKETTINSTSGLFDFPSDYVHRLELKYKYVKTVCDEITVKTIPIDYMAANEEAYTLNSKIRNPTLMRPRHCYKNNKIQVYPTTIRSILIKYLRKPQDPIYATTVVVNNNEAVEQYDAVNSVPFEWNEAEFPNLVDLCLLFKGIQVRENALIEYAKVKQKEIMLN